MAYSQAIVQRAMQRLQSENEQNEQSSRARIAAIYEKQPRLGEIERELRRTAAHVLAATFRRQGDPVAAMQQLKKDNLALQQERDWILQAARSAAERAMWARRCANASGSFAGRSRRRSWLHCSARTALKNFDWNSILTNMTQNATAARAS